MIPLSVQAGVFSKVTGIFNSNEVVYDKYATNSSASDLKLLTARVNPETTSHQGGGDVFVDEGALLSGGQFNMDTVSGSASSGEISIHTVRPCTESGCETLSHIAEMYGVSVNTILWANDISDPKSVRAGDTLVILPITGVRHIVKDKETLASIAKKYGAETSEQVAAMTSDIMAYNRLASASEISVGDTVVIPGGVMHTAAVSSTIAKSSSSSSSSASRSTATTARSSGAGFVNPLPGGVRTQGIHGYNAVDIAAASGTPIRAAADGEVIVSRSSGWNGGYGIYIVIKHANGAQTLYSHMSGVTVGSGARVTAGETIGYVGNTGKSTGPHLHFEVRGATNPF